MLKFPTWILKIQRKLGTFILTFPIRTETSNQNSRCQAETSNLQGHTWMYFDCKMTIFPNQYDIPKTIESLLHRSLNLVPIQHKLICNIFIFGMAYAIFI